MNYYYRNEYFFLKKKKHFKFVWFFARLDSFQSHSFRLEMGNCQPVTHDITSESHLTSHVFDFIWQELWHFVVSATIKTIREKVTTKLVYRSAFAEKSFFFLLFNVDQLVVNSNNVHFLLTSDEKWLIRQWNTTCMLSARSVINWICIFENQ